MSSRSSGASATRCGMTASTTATTSNRSPTCCSSRWRTSAGSTSAGWRCRRAWPIDCSWPALAASTGAALPSTTPACCGALGQQPGLLGDIFTRAASRFNNPVNLKRLIDLIDETEMDHARGRRQGRGLRGPAGEGRERGEEGGRPVLHAAPADPVDRALRAPRSARASGSHDLRSGLRHRRLPRGRLRVVPGRDAREERRPRARSRGGCGAAPTSARSWCRARGAWR